MDRLKTPPNIIWTLPFFSNLKQEEKAALLKVSHFRHAQPKEMLFLQGDPLTQLYWICSGAVQIFRETPSGQELTMAIRMIGDMLFDPDALQYKQNHAVNARAMQETTLLAVPLSWIEEHLKSYDHIANKLVFLLAQRAQEAQIEAEHQATMSAAQIVACFLQHLCVVHHYDPAGFELPYSKSLIASRLGMTLESFSRTLPKLKKLGITVKDKRVTFDDIAAIQQFSCGSCSVIEECRVNKMIRRLAQDIIKPCHEIAG